MNIHPTAIVSPGAKIAEDVEIGAYAMVGEHVTLGAGCVVQARAIVEGYTTLGEKNIIGYGAVIGAPPQDFAFKDTVRSEVIIGNGNTFREYVTIHRGTKEGTATVVGDGCYLMVGSHLGHNVKVGNKVIIANNCLLGGYCEVGDGAVLGGGAVFHQFLRIGRLAIVGGGTRFNKDIPPFVSADGENMLSATNTIGLRRAGFSREARMEIRRAFKHVFRSGLNVSDGIAEARKSAEWSPEAEHFFDFIKASKRGVCWANGVDKVESDEE
jgi:UDP-N-acetylglucosamine acyltransferase